ncbi:MerR family transcriptional regulator [Kushneria phosphatilytica]|uniref:MerR family transcriptional regulator n=1 Tax=Kushneria phosphatilytica TaxID=657387 RepID=A0A1S1NYG1_9GAMM|nr:MerR family transcriptional regulator [Kushneria phosphatilytica]OHV13915.1 hypothetical protein BH688_00780 [Kushneria phosphatilytica]QEL10475.1 MerR family transcriptional regulator [Kushneria phosphatilytica]
MASYPCPRALSIGELARQTGASRRSLRHYDEQGLLASARADNGYRLFPPGTIVRVRQIRCLISAGFSLEEIRTFPECMLAEEGAGACPETLAVQRQRLTHLEQQIAEFERRRALLCRILEECESAIEPVEQEPAEAVIQATHSSARAFTSQHHGSR